MGRVAKLFAALALVAAAAGAQPTPIIPHIHHATDCTAATANRGTQCWEEDSARLFTCVPTVGTCDTAGEWILALTTLAGDVDGSSGANDLDEAAVEAELEAVQDLQDFQGAVTDGQVPDNITLALESASLTAILDDEVLVGTGAAAGAYTALQNCNDTTGKLDWTGSAFACVTDAGGAMPDRTFVWSAESLAPRNAADSIPPLALDQGTNWDVNVRDFDAAADECVGFSFVVPEDITSGGTVTFEIDWYAATAGSGDAIWYVTEIDRAAGENWDTAGNTETSGASAADTTQDEISVVTWTETQTNLAWAAGDYVLGEVCRDANNGSDTIAGDARLLAFYIRIPQS
jgi:hypothetical protein